MAHLRRLRDGKGDSGSLSQAIRWNEDDTYKEVVDSKPIVGCSMLVGAVTARSYTAQDYWLTTPITEILEVTTYNGDDLYYRFKTGNSEYEWWTGNYPKDKQKSIVGLAFEEVKYQPLLNQIRVINELYFINTISDGGYRGGYWREEEDPTLDKLYKFSNQFSEKIVDQYEKLSVVINKKYTHKPYERTLHSLLRNETNQLLVELGYRESTAWSDDENIRHRLIDALIDKHFDGIISTIEEHKKYNTELR